MRVLPKTRKNRFGADLNNLAYLMATTWSILHKDLGLEAYKIQLVQELKPADLPKRHNFSRWALGKLAEDPQFGTRISFSDEGRFWLNGYVNKQNCRIWAYGLEESLAHISSKTRLAPM